MSLTTRTGTSAQPRRESSLGPASGEDDHARAHNGDGGEDDEDPRRHAEHLMLLLRHANLCDKPCGLQDEDEHYYDGDHEGENGDRACVHGDVSFIRGATHSGGRRVQRPVPIHAVNIGADVDSVRG